MGYVMIPQIVTATVTPNPADINSAATVTVTVRDVEVWVEPPEYRANEIYAGEAEA